MYVYMYIYIYIYICTHLVHLRSRPVGNGLGQQVMARVR